MKIALGVDTLCYHCRIEAGNITVEDVFAEIAELGASYIQLDLYHVRDRSTTELEKLRGIADDLGLRILTSGEHVGTPRSGDTPASGVERIAHWAEAARAVNSPIVRVASGFYRAELAGDNKAILAEQRFVIETLNLAAEKLDLNGLTILLENHSDFTPEEYGVIVKEVGPERMGVFLDLINPVAVLADPLEAVTGLLPYAVAGHVKDYRFASHYVPDNYHRRSFEVQWCYPGEGAADLPALISLLRGNSRDGVYGLAIEGLDNYPDIADQRERLEGSLTLLRDLLSDDLATVAAW